MRILLKYNQLWMSIVEVLAVIVVIWVWLTTAWYTIARGQDNAVKTELRINAINIAREWIEIAQNIRNSNWIKLSSDTKNCWFAYNYDTSCIGNNTLPHSSKIQDGCYIPFASGGFWYLTPIIATGAGDPFPTFYQKFPVFFDTNGLIAQTGATVTSITKLCAGKTSNDCKSAFARALCIKVPDQNTMQIESIVRWVGWSENRVQNISLETVLKNWKANF